MKRQFLTRLIKILAVTIFAAGWCIQGKALSIFNFDADTPGTNTQFTDSSNGISATFSSPGDPGGFAVEPSSFLEALTGNALGDPGSAGQNGIPLDIGFSSNLSAISLVFATADFGSPSPLTLSAYEDGTAVGNAVQTGIVPDGFTFPEGEIAFEGAAFNRVVLSSTAPDFIIDDVAVAPVPEPRSALVMGLGLLALGFIRFRRKTARAVRGAR